jgi:heparanase 1
MVNTLASSDYGLLEEDSFEPRPNYWAALLWKQAMGTRVLDPGVAPDSRLRVYAHCAKDAKGAVSILALNLDGKSAQTLSLPEAGVRYTLSAPELLSPTVLLNGAELKASADGTVPKLIGQPTKAGVIQLAPQTITFITLPKANNSSCM